MDHHVAEGGRHHDGCHRVPVAAGKRLRLDDHPCLVGPAQKKDFVAPGFGDRLPHLQQGLFGEIALHLVEDTIFAPVPQ